MTLSKNALAFLTKAAKGIKGGFDPAALAEALPLLGWAIGQEVVPASLDGEKAGAFLKPVAAHAGIAADFVGLGGKDPIIALVDTREQAATLVTILRQTLLSWSSKGPPIALGAGQMATRGIGPYVGGRHGVELREVWRGMPGYRVRTESGDVVFTPKLSYTGRVEPLTETGSDRFWTFAYKSGLKAKAAEAIAKLGAESVAAALRPVSARSLEDTGTCPACFSNVKLHEHTMMRHGWSVSGTRYKGAQGMSWHTGPCFGFHYPPFELSPQGTIEYIAKVLRPTEARMQENRAELRLKPSLTMENYRGQKEVITPSDRRYDGEWGSRMRKIDRSIETIQKEIAEDAARVKGWKRRPLPGSGR